jgi:transcriptional regulator with XRE-family HTH domain
MADEILPFARMLQSINDLTQQECGYTPGNMVPVTWEQMREQFKQERLAQKKRGLTQVAAAKLGGVDQSAISKIESDLSYTPYVDTFVNAVYGLGMTATEFFAPIEGLKIVREGGKTAVAIPANAETPAVLQPVTKDDLDKFVLDLIDKLQDLVAAHDQRRERQRAAAKAHRKTAAPRPAKASENSRTRTQR